MRMEDMVLVSVDDHAVEPRDMFERHGRRVTSGDVNRMLADMTGQP
jgi:predicted RNA-binding protein